MYDQLRTRRSTDACNYLEEWAKPQLNAQVHNIKEISVASVHPNEKMQPTLQRKINVGGSKTVRFDICGSERCNTPTGGIQLPAHAFIAIRGVCYKKAAQACYWTSRVCIVNEAQVDAP